MGKVFSKQKIGKIQENFGLKYQFNQISCILAKFHKYYNTKKMNKNKIGKLPFAPKQVASNESTNFIPLFHVYDLLLEHFVSSHGHTTLAIHQNIGKE